jgi:LEA14-like dessication related protein
MKGYPGRTMAALLTAVLLAACAGGLKRPEVRMEGVRVGGLGLTGGLVYVQLRVTNPNGRDLATNKLTYDFDLADPSGAKDSWVDFAEGVYDQEIRVNGHDSTTVEIPIEFSYRGAGPAIRSVIERGTLSYRVKGTVGVTKPLSTEVPFKKQGVVTLSGAQ